MLHHQCLTSNNLAVTWEKGKVGETDTEGSPSAQTVLAVPKASRQKASAHGSLKQYRVTVKFPSLIMMEPFLRSTDKRKKIGTFIC